MYTLHSALTVLTYKEHKSVCLKAHNEERCEKRYPHIFSGAVESIWKPHSRIRFNFVKSTMQNTNTEIQEKGKGKWFWDSLLHNVFGYLQSEWSKSLWPGSVSRNKNSKFSQSNCGDWFLKVWGRAMHNIGLSVEVWFTKTNVYAFSCSGNFSVGHQHPPKHLLCTSKTFAAC